MTRFHKPGMARIGWGIIMLLGAISGAFLPAQGQALEYWELPMTRDSGICARALGMGGAYLALSDDCAALRYNPAGLAQVKRIEFAGSVTDVHREIATTADGTRQRGSVSRTRVALLGFAYPFPTYQGSMVIAFGYCAPWIEDRVNRRWHLYTDGTGVEETFEEGTVGEWSFGYALDVARNLSLGFRASFINGSYYRESTLYFNNQFDARLSNDYDVHGFTGSLGALARAGDRVRLGFVIDLPRWVHMHPTQITEDGWIYQLPSEDLTYPFSAAMGVAFSLRNLLLAADARFTDWAQIDYEGPYRYTDTSGTHDVYRRTWNLNLGAEYLLDLAGAGLRLRAGFAYEPVPYQILLQEFIQGDDPSDDRFIYTEADFDPHRHYFSFGAGMLIQESTTIDAAFTIGSHKREITDLGEDHDERRLLLTAAFRLN